MSDLESKHRAYVEVGKNVYLATNPHDDEDRWSEGIVTHVFTPSTEDYVKDGIKVRIDDGTIGYVKKILTTNILTDAYVQQMISNGETTKVEFKETFKINSKTRQELKCLRYECVKEIAAFMNTFGGNLIIGVDDSSNVIGLDRDYNFINCERSNQTKQDKLKQEIRSYIKSILCDKLLETRYDIRFKKIDGNDICVIQVFPSDKPVFLNQDVVYTKCDNDQQTKSKCQKFYIRTDTGTSLLDPRQLLEYWKNRSQ